MNPYKNIRTLQDLNAAQQALRRRIDKQGDQVYDRFCTLRSSVTPSKLLQSGVRQVTRDLPLRPVLLLLVRQLRRRLLR